MESPSQRVNRRDLLRGWKSAGKGGIQTATTPVAKAHTGDLLRATRRAMGTFFDARLPATAPGAVELASRILDRIDALESQLTIYRDDSEVSRLNARAFESPVSVEHGLFQLLQTCLEIGRKTEGAFDAASGALWAAWGFFRGPKRVPAPAELALARRCSGQHLLKLDPQDRGVSFLRPGLIVNFGSIGKGYALDQAALLVKSHWWPISALLQGGQSSVLAIGSPPGNPGGRWRVALQHPRQAGQSLGELKLRNRALATSGSAYQSFEHAGRTYAHIIDPRTGEPPPNPPLSVTVLAPSAAEADALSTAFFILGPEFAARYVARYPEIGAAFVLEGSSPSLVKLLTLNLGPSDFDMDCQFSQTVEHVAGSAPSTG